MANDFDSSLFEDQPYDEALFEEESFEEEIAAAPSEVPIPAMAALGGTAEAPPEPLAPGQIGPGEAAFVHGAEALTLGLSDIAAGAGGALGTLSGELQAGREVPSKGQLLASYYEAKRGEAARREAAMEQQPAASAAGMVGGALLTPIPGAALAKGGKIAKSVAKVLPSLKGSEKITRAGRLAEKARLAGDMDKYNRLKNMQRAAARGIAAREGLKVGAVTSATQGEAELLRGEFRETAKEVATGAATGVALGHLVTAGSQKSADLIKKIPGVQNAIDSFSFGLKGVDLDNERVKSQTVKTAKKYITEFEKKLTAFGGEKDKILQSLDDAGITINSKEDLIRARAIIKGMDSPTERKRAEQFLNVLDDYIGEGKAVKKAQEKMEKELAKSRVIDPVQQAKYKSDEKALNRAIKEGKIPDVAEIGEIEARDILGEEAEAGVEALLRQEVTAGPEGEAVRRFPEKIKDITPGAVKTSIDPITGRQVAAFEQEGIGRVTAVVGEVPSSLDAESLTTGQAKRLQKLMNEYSALAAKENMPAEVKQAATEAAKLVGKKIEGAAEKVGKPVAGLNKKISSIIEAKEIGGVGREITELNKDKNIQALSKFIAGTSDTNPLSDKSLFIKRLRKVDPAMAEDISREIDELRSLGQLSKPGDYLPAHSTQLKALLGSATGILNKVANALGQAAGAPVRAVREKAGPLATKLSRRSLQITGATPEEINSTIGAIEASGKRAYQNYIGPLRKAADAKQRTKQAIMFGLYQQPAFREMIDELFPEGGE